MTGVTSMNSLWEVPPRVLLVGGFLALGTLAFDISMPLGVAGGVPYVALVLSGVRSRSGLYILLLAGLGSFLTILGWYLSPAGGIAWVVMTNRGLALFAIWVSALLAHRWKREEVALVQSENKYRDLVDGSIEGIFIHHNGRVVYANQMAADIYGYPLDELIGLSPPEKLLHRDEIERIGKIRQQLPVEVCEFRGLRRDRSVVQLQALIRSIDWEGEPAFQLTVQDVTARNQAQAQLHQAQKMEVVGQLIGGLAHDFNNLLTIVSGNLELLGEALRGNDYEHGLAERALGAASRGATLVERLMTYSRQQKLDSVPTDINSVVSETIDLLKGAIRTAINVETRFADGLWSAVVDPGQLENALLNLAINARDAMPDGGTLTIETTNVWVDDRMIETHTYMIPGDYIVLAVTDTGVGMPPEVVERAFEPYFTTKETGKGSGLGLAMVYGFIKQTGGYVTIDSEPGHGTTIRLYLPGDFQASVPERGLRSA